MDRGLARTSLRMLDPSGLYSQRFQIILHAFFAGQMSGAHRNEDCSWSIEHHPDLLRPVCVTLKQQGLCKLRCYFRSEKHTSELKSLMRNSYAVICMTKKK